MTLRLFDFFRFSRFFSRTFSVCCRRERQVRLYFNVADSATRVRGRRTPAESIESTPVGGGVEGGGAAAATVVKSNSAGRRPVNRLAPPSALNHSVFPTAVASRILSLSFFLQNDTYFSFVFFFSYPERVLLMKKKKKKSIPTLYSSRARRTIATRHH